MEHGEMGMGITAEQAREHLAAGDIEEMQEFFHCTGEQCDFVVDAFADSPVWLCDGTANPMPGGSWIGHLLPGCMFMLWSCHWMLSMYKNYFDSRRRQVPYQSYGWLPGFCLPAWPIEPVIKVLLPFLAICMEMKWAHGSNGYRYLICPKGTDREGHMWGNHITNWQHASMYPAFLVSGVVDLVGLTVPLPAGTHQVMLSFAFLVEALLMGLHKKHFPLDRVVHELLFWSMLASFLATLLEACYPRNFLASCSRCATAFLQSAWFMASARIVFEGRTAWIETGEDMGPVMYAPLLFVSMAVCIIAAMFLVFLGFWFWYAPPGSPLPPEVHHRQGHPRVVSHQAGKSGSFLASTYSHAAHTVHHPAWTGATAR